MSYDLLFIIINATPKRNTGKYNFQSIGYNSYYYSIPFS